MVLSVNTIIPMQRLANPLLFVGFIVVVGFLIFFFFEAGSYCVAQASLKPLRSIDFSCLSLLST